MAASRAAAAIVAGARVVFEDPRPVAEAPSAAYLLILLTGLGSSSDWHTGTRTAKSTLLRSLGGEEPYVETSPADAALRSLAPGDVAVVKSARGEVQTRVVVTATVAPGTNRLTVRSFEPYSRQPSYKSAAVDVRRA